MGGGVRVKAIMRRPYTLVLVPEDDGGFSAMVAECRGCFAQGDDAEEAARNLVSAWESWLLATIAQGQTVPEPFDAMDSNRLVAVSRQVETTDPTAGDR
jgi:predicted RNase H-like HicB family nuclease